MVRRCMCGSDPWPGLSAASRVAGTSAAAAMAASKSLRPPDMVDDVVSYQESCNAECFIVL